MTAQICVQIFVVSGVVPPLATNCLMNPSEGSSNVQYTSRYCARVVLEAIDIWIERKLVCSLQESPYFSILADECQDISIQEELSICGWWLVNGKPEGHFLTVLHVHSTDASSITKVLQPFLQQKQLDLRKLIGQGYDGAATFAGKISGVHKRIQTSSAHAIHIHGSCHGLQLASIQAAASVKVIRMFFGGSWPVFGIPRQCSK